MLSQPAAGTVPVDPTRFIPSGISAITEMLNQVGTLAPEFSLSFSGIPTTIFGSAVGGIPYVVRDGVDGLLVPPGDPVALAEGLATVLAAPPGRFRPDGERWDWRHQVDRTVGLIDRVSREVAA